jgi:hypothetical protein
MELDNLEIEEGLDDVQVPDLEESLELSEDEAGDMPHETVDDLADLVLEDGPTDSSPMSLPVVLITPERDVEEEEKEEVEAPRETTWEQDNDHGKFLVYLHKKLSEIPPHSGQTTVGCEKAISYLKRLDREISKAIQGDENSKIDENEAEKLRDMIYDYIDQLEGAYEVLIEKKKKRKKASLKLGKKVLARFNDGENVQYFVSVSNGSDETLLPVELDEPSPEQVQAFIDGQKQSLTKEAGSARIILVEDPFLHAITRILINSHVAHGRNIEEVYAGLNDKYKFTAREELSIQELLNQKGLWLQKDLGRLGEKDVKPFDGKQIDVSTEYFA